MSSIDQTETKPTETLQPDPPPVAAPRRRGFASMDPERVREIARRGGKAAHEAGTAHEFTTEEAREAGRKGGQTAHANRRKRLDQGAQK